MNAAALARLLCPPFLWPFIRRAAGGGIRFYGPFATWDEAMAKSAGYSADWILDRVVSATRSVVAGDAAFERDGVLFGRQEVPFQLLTPVLRAATDFPGKLSVLDFGGSLGSTFRQCRAFLQGIPLTWNVIEQRAFVLAGKAEFETSELRFFESTEDIEPNGAPSVALFSSVLQYLEKPYEVFRDPIVRNCRYLVIDRTPFLDGCNDHIVVQKVPTRIYRASYPSWIFGYDGLRARLGEWNALAEFDCPEGQVRIARGINATFRGLILERKQVG